MIGWRTAKREGIPYCVLPPPRAARKRRHTEIMFPAISEERWRAIIAEESSSIPDNDDQESILRHRWDMMKEITRINSTVYVYLFFAISIYTTANCFSLTLFFFLELTLEKDTKISCLSHYAVRDESLCRRARLRSFSLLRKRDYWTRHEMTF